MADDRREHQADKQALLVRDQRQVQVLGDQLLAARIADGTIYLPARALCEALGLDRAAQVRRIKRDEAMREDLHEIAIQTESGIQTVQVLRLETVPYWLAGVTLNKVKPELRDKLLSYKRWVVRKVYEAFMLELSVEAQPQANANVQTLMHVRELGLALARLADEQIALERQQQLTAAQVEHLTLRMDKAANVVGQVMDRLKALEIRSAAGVGDAVSTEQASEISLAVKAIAGELARRDQKESNPYQRVFTALYQRYGIVTYKQLPANRFSDAMTWLQEWYQSLLQPSNSQQPELHC